MKQSTKFIGKEYNHTTGGKIIVDSVYKNSSVLVNVTFLERGKGWNEKTQSFTGHKNSIGWMRGENRDYLKKDIVHIKTLSNGN